MPGRGHLPWTPRSPAFKGQHFFFAPHDALLNRELRQFSLRQIAIDAALAHIQDAGGFAHRNQSLPAVQRKSPVGDKSSWHTISLLTNHAVVWPREPSAPDA